jgi:uncharacterized protein YkwD
MPGSARVPREEMTMRRLFLASLLSTLILPAAAEPDDPLPPMQYTASLLELINHYRAEHGMPALQAADQLALLAHEHSLYMAERGDISHAQFEQRYHRAGSRTCVENVGWNYRDPYEQFKGWQASAAHNAAMLEPKLRRGGIAIFEYYVTFFACS